MHFSAFIPPKKISNLCTCFPEFQLFDDLILVLKPTGLAMVNHQGPQIKLNGKNRVEGLCVAEDVSKE